MLQSLPRMKMLCWYFKGIVHYKGEFCLYVLSLILFQTCIVVIFYLYYTCQAPKSDEIKNMFAENIQLQLSNIILHCKVVKLIYHASFWLQNIQEPNVKPGQIICYIRCKYI